MDNVITINHTKENILELDISVTGIDLEDIRAWFNIKADGMDIGFECSRVENSGEKWSCVVPPLPFIQRTAYNFYIRVVADGYCFEPAQGTINVVAGHQIYSTAIKNTTIGPAQTAAIVAEQAKSPVVAKPKPARKKLVVEDKPNWVDKSLAEMAADITKDTNTPVANIVNAKDEAQAILTENSKASSKPTAKKVKKVKKAVAPVVESKVDVNPADQAAIDVLIEMGIKPVAKERPKINYTPRSFTK